jgi:hypothetical protein
VLPEVAMPALPAATTPPVGSAYTFVPSIEPNAISSEAASAFIPTRDRPCMEPDRETSPAPVQTELFPPLLGTFSAAATKVPVLAFQIDRYMRFMMSFRQCLWLIPAGSD